MELWRLKRNIIWSPEFALQVYSVLNKGYSTSVLLTDWARSLFISEGCIVYCMFNGIYWSLPTRCQWHTLASVVTTKEFSDITKYFLEEQSHSFLKTSSLNQVGFKAFGGDSWFGGWPHGTQNKQSTRICFSKCFSKHFDSVSAERRASISLK